MFFFLYEQILENELMAERHKAEALSQEVTSLKFSLAAAKGLDQEDSYPEERNLAITLDSISDGDADTVTDSVVYSGIPGSGLDSEADCSLTDDAASDDDEEEADEEIGSVAVIYNTIVDEISEECAA